MTLRQAVIGVHHQGCWGSRSTIDFSDVTMKEVGPIDVEHMEDGFVQLTATWKVSFASRQRFTEYLRSLDEYDMLKDVRLIKVDDNSALLKTVWIKKDSSYETVFDNKCLYTSPVTQKNGYEVYTIITDNPKQVEDMFTTLGNIGTVKLFSIGEVETETNTLSLTPKQNEALMIALDNDYYEWPKKKNLNEIAKKMGMNRRTFQENLRRAETKVFSRLKKELLNGE